MPILSLPCISTLPVVLVSVLAPESDFYPPLEASTCDWTFYWIMCCATKGHKHHKAHHINQTQKLLKSALLSIISHQSLRFDLVSLRIPLFYMPQPFCNSYSFKLKPSNLFQLYFIVNFFKNTFFSDLSTTFRPSSSLWVISTLDQPIFVYFAALSRVLRFL